LVDGDFVQNRSIGRIEEMKIFRRNLLLASSALALVMLFGCSSSEESSSESGEGDTDMTCDEGDSQQECLNDIL
jgi:ABC-type phosphate/phosphonate transport system substrate-binding protein